MSTTPSNTIKSPTSADDTSSGSGVSRPAIVALLVLVIVVGWSSQPEPLTTVQDVKNISIPPPPPVTNSPTAVPEANLSDVLRKFPLTRRPGSKSISKSNPEPPAEILTTVAPATPAPTAGKWRPTEEPSSDSSSNSTPTPTPPPKSPAALYSEVVHGTCQMKQPFLDQYEAMFKKVKTLGGGKQLWHPEAYAFKDSIRRFLKNWYTEVMAYRKKVQEREGGDPLLNQPPEARVLLIGDSLSRNMLYSFIVQVLDEGMEREEIDDYGTFARHVLQAPGDTYQTLYVTWPGINSRKRKANINNGSGVNINGTENAEEDDYASTAQSQRRATIKIRYEQEAYFSMDSHSLKSSRGVEFNPTHIFCARGMWDGIGRLIPHDPAIPLGGVSAGLVRLRKELIEYRAQLPAKERNLYPPARLVYWAMPKMFPSSESHCRQCVFDRDGPFLRDAFYGAVRRANGALLDIHGQENFDSVAVEIFDYYSMSMLSGAKNTHNGDCIHPLPVPRLAILAQMLDLVSQPLQTLESARQKVDSAQNSGQIFVNATMYVPPPLIVRDSEELTNASVCPFAFTKADIDKILNPPKLVGVGAAAALSEDVEDLTPPPVQRVMTSNGRELFAAMMSCRAPETLNMGTVRPIERARRALERITAESTPAPGAEDDGQPQRKAHALAVQQSRSDYLSACATMFYTWLFSRHTMIPFFTQAKKMTLPPDGSNKAVSLEEILWTGNRCIHFVNREVAAMGQRAFFEQLWNYTANKKMYCAVPPLVAWTMLQPAHSSLTGGLDGGDELVYCAHNSGGLRIRFKK